MIRVISIALLFLLIAVLPATAEQQPLPSAAEALAHIRALQAKPHPCAEIKAQRMEAAVKQSLLDQAMRSDGNQAMYDVRYYGIDLDISLASQWIDGHVDYLIQPTVNNLSSVDLNLHDQLDVDSVWVEGISSNFSHTGDLLTIWTSSYDTGEEFSLRVFYKGNPYSGYGYTDGGMGFDPFHNGNDICWTSCEPFYSRNWFPCKDFPEDKADSIDIYIDRPSNYEVAANGVLVSDTDIGGGKKRAHWKHNYPIVTYLIALSIADFTVEQWNWNYDGHTMPVLSYTYPNAYESRQLFADETNTVLNIYSDKFCLYPFVEEKLANVNCGIWGTMEHQTCSFHDPFSAYDQLYLLIHENAHQWWGDMITCRTFNHIWLNEGMGTWTEAVYYEALYGNQFYHDYMEGYGYLGAGTIFVEDVYNDVIFDGSLTYAKGSWVPHMLRGVLGEDLFWQAIQAWADSPFKYGTATTENFASVISNVAGSDMSWFVNQWIYGEGHPEYVYSSLCEADPGGGYILTYVIQQTQTTGQYFTMPIQTVFHTTGGNLDTTIWNSGAIQLYSIWLPDSLVSIEFDPTHWILSEVTAGAFTPHIATITLPDATLNEPYYFELNGIGGVEPYHWTKLGGDLPIGLQLEGDTVGTISGTPTWPANYYFTLRMEDSDSPPYTETRGFTIKVVEGTQPYVEGDANGDEIVNITDAVYLIQYIFSAGPAPEPLEAGDANCDTLVNITDGVYLIQYIFSGGPAPGCP